MLTSNSQLRSAAPIILSGALFAASILFAYVWFNTDIGRGLGDRSSDIGDSSGPNSHLQSPNSRSTNSHLQSPNSHPRIWLTAKTNIPGYTAHIAA